MGTSRPVRVAGLAVEDVVGESDFLFEGPVVELIGTPRALRDTAFGHGGQRQVLRRTVDCFERFSQ